MVGINNIGGLGSSGALGAASKAGETRATAALAKIVTSSALPYNGASASTYAALASLHAVQG